MIKFFFLILSLSVSVFADAKRIKLSSVSIEVPDAVTAGNKVTVTKGGLSQYAYNRLRTDSSAYYYTYSFRYTNGLFEFRETTKEDIYEWHESVWPKFRKAKEKSYYNEKLFVAIENPVLDGQLWGITNESADKYRKITIIYKFNQTTQFIACLKSAYNPEGFLAMQDSLVKMLETVRIDPYVAPVHQIPGQSGSLAGKIRHELIELPLGLSNDFNNPVAEQLGNGDVVLAFAHSTGSEIFRLNKEWKIVQHEKFTKIVHDIVAYGDEFFTVASTDYNKMTWGIYPSLYLTKHSSDCSPLYWNLVFKRQKLRLPGHQTFDYYSRDNVCIELVDSIGLIYCNSERKFGDFKLGQAGAWKLFSAVGGMKKKADEDLWHVSHCFVQKSVSDERFVYLFSIGDMSPRALCLSKIDVQLEKDSVDTSSFYHLELNKINGPAGDNYILDSHLSNPVIYKNRLFIVLETESDARADYEDNQYSSNRGANDLFLVSCTKSGTDIKVDQITKTKNTEEVNPKLAIHHQQLLLLFTEVTTSKAAPIPVFEDRYLYLDEKGNRKSPIESIETIYLSEKKEDWKMPDSPTNRDGNDLLKLRDGSILWIRLLKNTRQLECVLISE